MEGDFYLSFKEVVGVLPEDKKVKKLDNGFRISYLCMFF